MAQKKAKETMRKSPMDLAQGLAGADSGLEEWSPLEIKVCVAMCSAAMRMGDMDRLVEAIDSFGGYPNPVSDIDKECVDLLHQSAQRPGAFGFGYLLGKAWALKLSQGTKTLDELHDRELNKELGGWLRRGLFNSAWDDQRDARESLGASSHRCMPIAACLVGDNPVALAEILSVPSMMESLVSMEPKKMGDQVGKDIPKDDWQYAKKMAEAVKSAGSGIETSLLFQAVSCKAFKCAALLAMIPEFSADAFTPGALGCALARTAESRRAQTVFEEKGKDGVEYSLFEMIVAMDDELDRVAYSERDRLRANLGKLVDSAIAGAPSEAKTMEQSGTGMGWALMHAARAKPWRWGSRAMEDNEFAARDIQRAMSVWDAMEREGFDMPWDTLAQLSGGCDPLRQWLELKSASKPSGKLASKRSASL